VHKRCKDCYCVRRGGVLYVRCKTHARHHQRQGRSRSQAN
jgi:ribosomal protein L36